MSAFLDLVRGSVRGVRRHPVYSTFAVITLAIAIGGGTLVFSLYDAIALRRLPVDRPRELVSVRILSVDPNGETADFGRLSFEDFEELRDAAAPLAELTAWAEGAAVLRSARRTESAEVQWVDSRYFDVLGVRPLRGRLFEPGDDPRQGGSGGVVLSERAWARFFGRDPEVTTRTIEVDGTPRPVIGIAPAAFRGVDVGTDPALFALSATVPESWDFFRMTARLRPSAGAAQLEARLTAAREAIEARRPERRSFMIVDGKASNATERIEVVDGSRGESSLRGDATLPIAIVGALLVLVLAVLAANLANLLAVRALSERGAAAIRIALGASRASIAFAWFAEGLLLTTAGAALGVAVIALWGERLLEWAPLPPWTHGLAVTVDLRTIAVALALAVAVSFAVSSVAAWEQSRVDPQIRLREESSTTFHSRGRVRWRNGLIASQVALSIVLLVAMGLFVRSAGALLAIDTGFPLARVATFRLDVPEPLADAAAERIARLRDDLARIPGVAAAGFSTAPILGGVRGYSMAAVEGYRPKEGEVMMLNRVGVSPGLLETLEIPVIAGRSFEEADRTRRTGTIVVNREFARRYFADADPLGRRISFNFKRADWSEPDAEDVSIIGVVDDRMISNLRETPTPRVYALFQGAPVSFYVRSTGDPMRLAAAITPLARERVPEAAVSEIRTLEQERNRSVRRELLTRDLSLAFGGMATGLAALGLFAVLSYLAGERRRELGLRQALGARPRDLARQILADGLRPVAAGIAAGLLIAAALARFAESQLFGVEPRDAVSFGGAVVVMVAISVLACIPPALRAARTSPSRALRG